MPILDVEIVLQSGESFRPGLAGELADRAGEVFGATPGTTWVKVRAIPAKHYAENQSGHPTDAYPVFVSVLKAKLPPPDERQREVTRLTEAVARVCRRPPENVHILYQPEGAGRVAFGGRIVPD
jgi:phenylpyruvate tautomerase PptA (4-oxalocrotonate tautomerase family)